jgi:hypothetical protein
MIEYRGSCSAKCCGAHIGEHSCPMEKLTRSDCCILNQNTDILTKHHNTTNTNSKNKSCDNPYVFEFYMYGR